MLQENQYVSLDGKLNTIPIRSDDGKNRKQTSVNVTELFISEDSKYLKDDINRISLLGSVALNILTGSNYRTFNLKVPK